MLSLLKELSVFKTLDEEYQAGAKGPTESEAHRERERRRLAIKQRCTSSPPRAKGVFHKGSSGLLESHRCVPGLAVGPWGLMVSIDQTQIFIASDNCVGLDIDRSTCQREAFDYA